jgi:uncharacterized lipoprotein YddW (UPF0748 family)
LKKSHSLLRLTTFLLFASSFFNTLYAQSPKCEFRGAWIATVGNIDWPSKQGMPSIEQQLQFSHRLDQLQAVGCNAVIVQIRPACDAFYASKIEPWSRYLTGRQGEPPFPYYDPLIYMVDEAHKRNMEFHAWFNPFRALVDSRQNLNPPGHVTHVHKEYVIKVITDVVKRYDIDAVHLDDYFYPYRIKGQMFGDGRSYARYGQGMDREDWRRNNVSLFISLLNSSIKAIKPYMKLGISPFGIWRNKDKDPEGSETRGGQTNYDDLYADVLMWMQKGWIDYLLPQLYWEHTSRAAPFGVLVPWWYGHCYRRHMYYGLGLYRMTEAKKTTAWHGVTELLWQLRDIRSQCPNSGFCFYSASIFDKIGPQLKDSLHLTYNKSFALIPPMTWLDSIPPAAPVLSMEVKGGASTLKWEVNNPQKEPMRFVVYKFKSNEQVNLENSDKIIAIVQNKEYADPLAKQSKNCTYIVTALDRLWNESKPSNKLVQ